MQSPLLQHTERNIVWSNKTWLFIVLILCACFFGQIKNNLLLQREHVCQLLFRSMCADNGIILIYLRTRYCIRTMQFHIMLCLFQINVSMLRPKRYSWSMSSLNTRMRLRENHVVLLAITMKRMDLNHILPSWYSNT